MLHNLLKDGMKRREYFCHHCTEGFFFLGSSVVIYKNVLIVFILLNTCYLSVSDCKPAGSTSCLKRLLRYYK